MSAVLRASRSPWLPVAGAALAVGLVYLAIFSVPPLITTFVDDVGLSHGEAGALMSVCLAGFLVGSLASGRLAGRFGPVAVIVAGLVLCGAATVAFAITSSLPAMLIARVAIGFAGGIVYAPGVTVVTSVLPPARHNIGVGVFLCGLSIGGTVAFLTTRLISEELDWRWPSWIFGAAVLLGAVAVGLLARGAVGRAESAAAHGGYGAVLADRTFLLLAACLFVALFVAYGVFTWIPPYLDEVGGFSTAAISLTSFLMTFVGIPATLAIGWLADRSGRPLGVAAIGLALPLSLAAFAAGSLSYAALTLAAALSALGVSGGLSPLYALAPGLGGASPATASGLAAAAAVAGGIASTYLGGLIVGDGDGYETAFAVYTAAAALCALVLVPLVAASLRRARVEAAEGVTARAR